MFKLKEKLPISSGDYDAPNIIKGNLKRPLVKFETRVEDFSTKRTADTWPYKLDFTDNWDICTFKI